MSCESGWYETVFYSDQQFAVLQPSQLIPCYKNTSSKFYTQSDVQVAENDIAETRILLIITTLFGLSFLLFIMIRSCNKFGKTDLDRLFMVMQNYLNSANDIKDPSNDAKGVLIDAMGVER